MKSSFRLLSLAAVVIAVAISLVPQTALGAESTTTKSIQLSEPTAYEVSIQSPSNDINSPTEDFLGPVTWTQPTATTHYSISFYADSGNGSYIRTLIPTTGTKGSFKLSKSVLINLPRETPIYVTVEAYHYNESTGEYEDLGTDYAAFTLPAKK